MSSIAAAGVQLEQRYIARGAQKMNATLGGLGYFFTDFAYGSTDTLPFGTTGVDASLRGGVISCVTAASSAATSGGTSQFSVYEGTASEPFYVAGRIKLVSAATATTTSGIGAERAGVWVGTDYVFVGLRGATSTSYFSANIAGNTGTSTIGIDTAWHIVELWSNGTTGYLSVDSETPVSITLATPGSPMNAQFGINNGAGGGAKTLYVDWGLWLWNRTA